MHRHLAPLLLLLLLAPPGRCDDASDLEVLARIVKGECPANMPTRGMVAVAAVVLNRVESDAFPDTIPGVAHQPKQFSCYNRNNRKRLYGGDVPDYAWEAAMRALEGEDPTDGCEYYFNPHLVSPSWAKKLEFVIRIGETRSTTHDFYRTPSSGNGAGHPEREELELTSLAPGGDKPDVRFVAAGKTHYRKGRGRHGIQTVVIHTIEGSTQSAINTFKTGKRRVSAHYIVGLEGDIVQMVDDEDTAQHVGQINGSSIGIEHEGYADRDTWTREQLVASARLTRWLCDTYGIPIDREHIIGHSEAPGATHHDPGAFFDWELYMRLVRGGRLAVTPLGDTPQVVEGPKGPLGWRVRWRVDGGTPSSVVVLAEELSSGRRFSSPELEGSCTEYLARARLRPGETYRWKVRVREGETTSESRWAVFRLDSLEPLVLTPVDGPRGSGHPERSGDPVARRSAGAVGALNAGTD